MKNLISLAIFVLSAYMYFQDGFHQQQEENKVLYCVESSQNCSENYRAPAVVMYEEE